MPHRLEWSLAEPYGELHRWSEHADAAGARGAALAVLGAAGTGGLRVIRVDEATRADVADALPDAASLLAWNPDRRSLPADGEGNPLLAVRRAADRADAFGRDLLRLTAAAARDGVIAAGVATELQDVAAAAMGRPDPRWPRGRPV